MAKHTFSAKLEDLTIRQLNKNDIELLRTWRNDKSNSRFLRDVGYITQEMQQKWFLEYLENERELAFAIEDDGKLNRVVGSLAVYDWDKEQGTCKIGKIQIGDSGAHGKGIGRKSLLMAMKIAFKQLGIKKITGSVHPDNVQAFHNDMELGFRVIGEKESVVGGSELLLEIDEEETRKHNSLYDQIIVSKGEESVSK